jgi:hypothetical protein
MAGINWNQVVFSDEKWWEIRPGSRVRVWRRKGQRCDPRYTVKTTAHPEKIMVWAAINGKGEVIVRLCADGVDAAEYQNVLGSALYFIKGSRYACKHFSKLILGIAGRPVGTFTFNKMEPDPTPPTVPNGG